MMNKDIMHNPKISVITVCYNSATHLEETILSVIQQDYANKEYVVIDGGSTDGSLDIINRYRDHIDHIVPEPDQGISDAFNKGLRLATGDLIQMVNADDVLMPGVLSKLAQLYEPDVDVYKGYCQIWYQRSNTKRICYPNDKIGVPPISASICHESTFISRRAYDRLGGYHTDYHYLMDTDLYIRMYRDEAIRQKFIDVCVITFRDGGISSSSPWKMKDEIIQLVTEHGGNRFQAWTYLLYRVMRYWAKNIIEYIRRA